jgi:hypothetical protein
MTFFGSEFIAAAPANQGAGSAALLDVDAITRELANQRGRAILYIPPGRHQLPQRAAAYGTWGGDLELGANVTVWFDDRAEIELLNSRLVIDGGIVAPARRVFVENGSNALVIVRGMQSALLTEWWGAVGRDGVDDRDAVQRAIDAATVRRLPVGAVLPPIPVRFSRMYAISAPIVVGRMVSVTLPRLGMVGVSQFGRPNNVAARLEGLCVGALTPAGGLRAIVLPYRALPRDPPAGTTLLHLVGAQRTVVQDLAFDGAEAADFCVIVEPTPSDTVQQMHSVSIRRCAFRGARRVLLQAGAAQRNTIRTVTEMGPEIVKPGPTMPPKVRVNVPFEQGAEGRGDLLGLYIEDNDFVCDGDATPRPCALQLRAFNAVAARVARSRFRGSASVFIDAPAVMAVVESCDFDNALTQVPTAAAATASGFEAPSGEDIYLSSDRFREGDRSANLVLGALAVIGCTSRSGRFFGTVSPGPVHPRRPERANLILGSLHQPARTLQGGPTRSVYWGRRQYTNPAPSTTAATQLGPDATLCVVGSSLGAGMFVGTGAAQSVVLSNWFGPGSTNRPEFLSTRPGITARTIVFGLQALVLCFVTLLTLGCARRSESVSDASDAPDAVSAMDTVSADEDRPPPDDLIDDTGSREEFGDFVRDTPIPRDRPMRDAAAGIDAAPAGDVVTPFDVGTDARTGRPVPLMSDVITFTGVRNPRQSRANCPPSQDGDPSIAPPRLVFPMSPMRVTSRRPTLQWRLPPGVTGARVELCRDRCCTQRITTFEATGDRGRSAQELPPGIVFWRARGMQGERLGRETSFTWEFGVRRRDAPRDTAWGTIQDVNGDGYDDLVEAMISRDRTQQGYLGALRTYWGTANFSAESYSDVMLEGVGNVCSGDFNGDGLRDVISSVYPVDQSTGRREGRLAVLYGSSGGLQHSGWESRFGSFGCRGVIDVNGDGYSDVFCEDGRVGEPNRLTMLYGSPVGISLENSKQFVSSVQEPPDWPSVPGWRTVADVNDDGYGDVLVEYHVSNGSTRRYELVRGDANGATLTPDVPMRIEGVENIAALGVIDAVGDLNGDRRHDFIKVDRFDPVIYESTRTGQYRRAPSIFEAVPRMRTAVWVRYFLSPPDLNGDGLPELITSCAECGYGPNEEAAESYGRVWIRWSQEGSVDRVRQEITGGTNRCAELGGGRVSPGDLNGDGFDDVVFHNSEEACYWDYPEARFWVLLGGSNAMMSALQEHVVRPLVDNGSMILLSSE